MSVAATIFGMFLLLSFMALGGGIAIVPELHREAVTQHQWMTDRQFVDLYAITQVTPGPSMLIVCIIGYKAAGWLGTLAATLGMFGPSSLLMFYVQGMWDRFRQSPLRQALEKGLAPIGVGLMLSGAFIIAQSACQTYVAIALAALATITVAFTRVHLLIIMAVAGVVGWIGWTQY